MAYLRGNLFYFEDVIDANAVFKKNLAGEELLVQYCLNFAA